MTPRPWMHFTSFSFIDVVVSVACDVHCHISTVKHMRWEKKKKHWENKNDSRAYNDKWDSIGDVLSAYVWIRLLRCTQNYKPTKTLRNQTISQIFRPNIMNYSNLSFCTFQSSIVNEFRSVWSHGWHPNLHYIRILFLVSAFKGNWRAKHKNE